MFKREIPINTILSLVVTGGILVNIAMMKKIKISKEYFRLNKENGIFYFGISFMSLNLMSLGRGIWLERK